MTFEAEGQPQGAVDFKRYAQSYGLEEGDLGREFTMSGHTWTVVGLDPGKRVRPVQVRRGDNGKVYVADVQSVRRALREVPTPPPGRRRGGPAGGRSDSPPPVRRPPVD